ncbi:hypothetical protein Tco_0441046, partial [Tanacetum coccineum]
YGGGMSSTNAALESDT